jgi:hypothetical protein
MSSMKTLRITADVKVDHRIELVLPPEVPVGPVELVVTVESPSPQKKRPRTSLADWAENNAENCGTKLESEDVESFTGRRF